MTINLAPNRIEVPTGSQFQIVTDGASTFNDLWGSGSPEGVISANRGSSYRDIANGAIYVKVTGTGNTGWSAVSTGIGNRSANSVFGNPTAASAAAQDIAVAAERALGRTVAGNLAALSPRDFRAVSRRAMFAIPFSSTINWDLANGTYQSIASTGDFTLNFPSNVVAGEKITLYVTGSATTMTLGTGFELCGGGSAAIALSGSKNRVEIFFDTATTATVSNVCVGIDAQVIVNPTWTEGAISLTASGTQIGLPTARIGYIQRSGGEPAYFRTESRWRTVCYMTFTPPANGGIPQGATPSNVTLTLNRNLTNTFLDTWQMNFEVAGLPGNLTTYPTPATSLVANLTTARSVESYSVIEIGSSQPVYTFDVTDVVTEIVSDPTWTDSRTLILMVVLAASSPDFPRPGSGDYTQLAFQLPVGGLVYTN